MATKKNSKAAVLLRQGDVLLVPVPGLPPVADARTENTGLVDGRLILAEGEATGHAHAIEGPGATLVSVGPPWGRWGSRGMTRTYLVVSEPQTVRHEEHDPLPVGVGVYEVRRQCEYLPSRPMWVAD